MPWPFSESIKKRACRYLLQRYLGHFLQEKLSLEQLSLDLYQGTGSLAQVPLDKWCLNEILESADAPLEVTEGFIQSISLSVPWGSLLQDNCALEVRGLEMVFRPRPRPATGSEPMYWSSFMTSSMQLAKECLSQKLTDEQGEGSQPFEGLEKFAETIETVLRRVKVTFIDTVLRIEHVPENSKTGTALEIRIERTVYCDETADESSGINVHQPTAFAHKLLQLSGVSLFWDEFSASAKSSPVCSTAPVETEPKLSPSWNPKIVYEPHPQLTRNLPEIAPSDPVQIGGLIGRLELSLTLKQNEVLPGAKLDVDGQIDSIHLLLSPRQVHLLLDMLAAIAGPENSSKIGLANKDRKNRPMQQEDEYRIQMELNRYYLRKDSLSVGVSSEQSFYETETARTPSSREEEVFFSMADMDMSHSLSSLPPLGDPPNMDLELSLTSTYTNTPAGSPLSATVLQPTWGEFLDHHKEQPVRGSTFPSNLVHPTSLQKTSLPSRSVSVDESRPELIFRLAVGTFSISVLHIDPLSPPETSLNLNPLTPMAVAFFTCIEKIDPARFSTEDFKSFRAVFAEACSHDHLRFIGTGIKVSYEQRQRSASRYFSTDMSIGQMEFLECLFPTDFHSVPPHYTELLTFHSKEETGSHSPVCLQLHYKHSENRGPQGNQARLSSVPQRAELQIKLNPVCCELDISIVDRLNSLLQPQKLATVEMMASHMYTSYNKHISLHKAFTEVFLDDSHSPANCRISVQVATPALNLSVRFPIPDLRSDQERGPWFKKSLQKEILYLAFTDLEFKTEFIGGSTPEQIKLELTFRELIGSFQEEKGDPSIKFFHVSSGVDGDTTSSDDFDWPRIVLKINPPAMHSILERIAAEEEEENDGPYQEEEEGAAHSLKDVCDLRRPAPSPFSSRRVMFENEQMVMPGDPVEMTEFQDKAISNSHYVLELTLPNIYVTLPNKSFYEKLYNRIFNDLLLWEPTAPSPVETFENISYGIGLSVASQLINTFNKDSFSPFKSAVHYDEESGSEEETLQYFSTVDPNYRSRRKKKLDSQNKNSQSFLSVLLNINHGLMAVFTDVKQDNGDLLENKHGEFWLEFNSGSLFCVTKYEGFDDKHYVCLHSSSFSLYHKGIVDGVILPTETRLPSSTRPHWLEPTIYSSEEDGLSRTSSDGVGGDSLNMLSVAVKILSDKSESNTKEFLIAVGLKGATLQHRMLPSGLSWHEQILYFLNIADEPVLGYNPPTSFTTFHVHLWSCALDYRPLYLPIRSLLTVETFSVSSSVALDKSSSTLRIILDEAALHLSDKCNTVTINLNRDYVRVMDVGLLELTITAVKSDSDGEQTEPRFELHCSSDVVHVRTCSDSCAALMNLIQYIASYGDLQTPNKADMKSGAFQRRSKVDSSGRSSSRGPVLPEADQQILRDLMSDAMEEIDMQQATSSVKPQANGVLDEKSQIQEPCCSDLFLFPDESGNVSQEPGPNYASFSHHFISDAMTGIPTENDDFCILFAPKAAMQEKEEEPVIKIMVDDAIVIRDNYFSLPVKKTDTSKAPLHFPIPVVRYVVKEVSLVWHLYGGKDFGTVPPTSPAKSYISPHSSPSHTPTRHGRNTVCGGKGRNHDFLMEIQLSKVKFQHEVYPPCKPDCDSSLSEHPVSRQVFIVQDLEIRDRLATSQMNKFLYLYCSKEMPRKAHSNMLTVKALHVCPESGRSPQECCLRVSLMPLRLNIDQDALFFLKDFFTSLSTEVELQMTPDPEVKKSPGADVTCSLPRHLSTSKEPNLVISFPGPKQPSQNDSANSVEVVNGTEEKNFSAEEASFRDQPVFFREFRFTSEVPIRLDYHGKHVSMDQGTLAGILIGLAQLNCSELKLKRLSYRHGLLGVDKLFSYAITEWLNDIKKNQLPGILGGVGPMHSLVQLVQGLKDLVWLPIEQYRKDGRIVRGFQRGAASFGTSTAMAALELTNRMVQTIQAAAETAYDMVSPGTLSIEPKKTKRFPHHRLAHQPVDLREGVAKAYSVVKEGITDTAQTIYETAAREHESRGVTGAVGEVLRQIPPAVVKPLIVATEATSNVLGGMRNQIRPDVRQDESQKWRHGDD
ncbi:autophagy-related protein 2 homolog B isoform X1 [Macaca thibetana thibetana]|uniref:Autophagy related 2B n=2 Tax=Macaca mulatta TaxID=9544 RepID=F6PWS2_MACMU|nr:autophagy-related protein 2 homolog B isoform X1 [Macaca mulatta]XP_005562220.1 autophagy-related protein 2 homolog B isoform X1 [Macaca fascicularis]XP_050654954.1 autophagy-related protein 2 homolog B isoform X1 [Macaca thibetana thibetana]